MASDRRICLINNMKMYAGFKSKHAVFPPTSVWDNGWLVCWLVVFYVPSTARSFRDDTPIYCPLRRT